jgi:uncharacterized protein with HEPN domain
MSRDQQRLLVYLEHILKAIKRIEHYIEDMDEASFLNNELVQDAIVRNLEVIGEASKNIDRHYPKFIQEHSQVPFLSAYEMRNALSHGYFSVDFEVVWKTIERDLPDMFTKISHLLKTIQD